MFPEDQPEKPQQFFSGQNSADELTPLKPSDHKYHPDDEQSLGGNAGQSSTEQLINYQNLMSMTQGVD